MVQTFALIYQPEMLVSVSSRNIHKGRLQALQKIAELIPDTDNKAFPNIIYGKDLISITEEDLMSAEESKVDDAVKHLAKLAKAKRELQALEEDAIRALNLIEKLFEDEPMSPEDFKEVDESLKDIKGYIKARLRVKEARGKAQEARKIIDLILSNE